MPAHRLEAASKGGLLRHFKAVVPLDAVVACCCGRVSESRTIGWHSGVAERRRSELERGSIHAVSTQLCHEYPWRCRGPGGATPAQGGRPGQPTPDR